MLRGIGMYRILRQAYVKRFSQKGKF